LIFLDQPCRHRLSQATTPSTNTGHHWQYMAREHPFEGNHGPAQTNTQSETAMKMNSRKWQTAHARPLLEPAGFNQLVLVFDLRLLLPPAVRSSGVAFLQLSTTSSGEGRWLNLQIQRSRRIFYPNIAPTADWLTSVLDLLQASRH